MRKHISENKNEYNIRQVELLSVEIVSKENELETTKGFFNRRKIKNELKKLNRKLESFGNDVLAYEYNSLNNKNQ